MDTDRDQMLDLVHDAMIQIQEAKIPGCKLQEIVDAMPEVVSRQGAKHWTDQLVEDGRVIKRPGAGGLRALTEEEQDLLSVHQALEGYAVGRTAQEGARAELDA